MKNIEYFFNNINLLYKNWIELKYRLYYSLFSIFFTFMVCYYYINQIIYLLTNYLLYNMNSHRFIFTKITEVFYVYLEISLISSLLICFPFILFNLWLFIIPGLYKYERFYLNFFFSFIIILFIISFYISNKYIIPNILNFFLFFEKDNFYFPLHLEAKLNDYLLPIYIFLFYLIIYFQFPSILIILLYLDIIDYDFLIKKRKYFYLIFLLLSALIAPPDIYSQIILTFIMFLLYESILFIIFFFIKFRIFRKKTF